MAQGATSSAWFTRRAADQDPVGRVMAKVAVILVEHSNRIQSARGIMAGGTGWGGSHITACLVVDHDITGVVGGPIRSVTFSAIDAVTEFAPVNFLLEEGVERVMAGETDNGAIGSDLAHVLGCAIADMAVDAGQNWGGVEGYFVVLGGVWIKWVDDRMTELAVSRAIAGATFQDTGSGCVAGVASVLMDIDNEACPGMTA